MSDIEGWLLDLYPTGRKEMTICVKGEDDFYLLKDEYEPHIFVNGASDDLNRLISEVKDDERVEEVEFDEKFVGPGDTEKSQVLKIIFGSREDILDLAYRILDMGSYQDYSLFNVDVSQAQKYLHDKGLFPLGRMEISDILN